MTELTENISPYSSRHKYRLTPKLTHTFEGEAWLNPREIIVLNIIKQCRTVSSMQIGRFWTSNKSRQALKRLARWGIIWEHVLEAERKLNIYTPPGYIPDPDRAIREMALAELYLKIREIAPCYIKPAQPPLTGIILYRAVEFNVLVCRAGDNNALLPFLLKEIPRLIIIAENIDPVFKNLPCRITTDFALQTLPLEDAFFKPDGTPSKAKIFAEPIAMLGSKDK
ncbi:hypothetical protein NZJ93_12890 [Desulfofundulus thermocisternus]|nr:hypothetical protein [Desulfofundulus thermocisternus]